MSDYDYLVQSDRKTKYHVTNKHLFLFLNRNDLVYVFSVYILFETENDCTGSLFSIDIWTKVH